LNQQVAPLHQTDLQGNLQMGLIANIPFSVLSGWASALIAAAAAFETLEVSVLPD
jgi:hypothetical protein